MNVKRGSKPTAESTKSQEKLKNPQQPTTQALESQEGLKHRVVKWGIAFVVAGIPESQEGLKLAV